VKAGGDRSIRLGLEYVLLYVRSYWLWLGMLPILLRPRRTIGRSPHTRFIGLTIVVWLAYVVFLGGDFMEFRFLVPVAPMLMLLLTLGIDQFRWLWTRLLFVFALVTASFVHAQHFEGTVDLESVDRLGANVLGPPSGWAKVGRVLGEQFHHDGCEVLIATTPTGAIPYYSQLPVVDMLGLNDAWVARKGARFSSRPGHQRLATHSYLMERGVNLVLGQPQIDSRRRTRLLEYRYPDLARFFLIEMVPEQIPREACVIEIPLDEEYKLTALYLKDSPCVDSAITRNGWSRFPIVRAY
jgi:arabinofuranosyltransferase